MDYAGVPVFVPMRYSDLAEEITHNSSLVNSLLRATNATCVFSSYEDFAASNFTASNFTASNFTASNFTAVQPIAFRHMSRNTTFDRQLPGPFISAAVITYEDLNRTCPDLYRHAGKCSVTTCKPCRVALCKPDTKEPSNKDIVEFGVYATQLAVIGISILVVSYMFLHSSMSYWRGQQDLR
ncbi:hypothetical protein BU16DRAFT_528392 [Lophium mytilinum]|uniref:Uncharacterized protein n=1 Tax=Lophium mytilinum TaxID=390894 RepID=A0A6A6QQ38_9PEZI|nr:hypothetical protein BU16DRAFT_528392 [Lophium mytilinum]